MASANYLVGHTAQGPTDLAAVLTQLCNLFALHKIHFDRGWFLEQGYLENNKSKAIRKLINRLCAEVRQQAVPLVDAFGIPDTCLGAPIAQAR